MIFAEKIEITAVPPFCFDFCSEIFANGDKQIRSYEKGRFWQVIRVNGKLFFVVIESIGTVNKPRLAVELKSNSAIASEDTK